MFNYLFFLQQDNVPSVSPGPLSEGEFVNRAKDYLLPEYTTGFLLAKDVRMSFRGLSATAHSYAVHQSLTGAFSGRYGPFHARSILGRRRKLSSLKLSTESETLHIEVPGAQIIGYFTSVVAKFPKKESD